MAILLSLAFAASFAGGLHAAFDTLSVLRVPIAALLIATLAFRAARTPLVLLVAGIAALFLGHHALRLPGAEISEEDSVVLFQKNLWFGNREHAALASAIAGAGADVITLQEVSDINAPLLELLAEDYPHQHLCRFSAWSGIAVLSRLPVGPEAPICSNIRGFAAMQIETAQGPRWVASVHLSWPFPYSQSEDLKTMLPSLAGLASPLIVAGDFNAMPWSHSVRTIANATGLRNIGPRRATLTIRHVPLPIDHVLAARGTVERLAPIGSDHSALIARIPTSE